MQNTALVEGNALIAALRPDERERLASVLVSIDMPRGAVLCETGDAVRYAWFPCDGAVAAFTVPVDGGRGIETAMVGREGALGGIVSEGHLPAYARATVVLGGTFWRLALSDLADLMTRMPSLRQLFARYADCLLAQVFQSVACNATHSIEQRAAKWLSATAERADQALIAMTQEEVAMMIGVGRSYTSRILQRFKAEGLLRTRRGGIEILDFGGLAGRSCTCNEAVARHYAVVLEGVYAADA